MAIPARSMEPGDVSVTGAANNAAATDQDFVDSGRRSMTGHLGHSLAILPFHDLPLR